MDWIKWRDEILQNAVDHGWWDEDRTGSELVCLFHSELSEALEEYRADEPMVYGLVIDGEDEDLPRIETDMEEIRRLGLKPEGAAVELADVVIRILDWFGMCEFDDLPTIDNEINGLALIVRDWDLPRLLAECHQTIADAWKCWTIDNEDISSAVLYIWGWLSVRGYDLEQIMELKHNYNKSRPYRHGGKRI